jgi:hypothetical protein
MRVFPARLDHTKDHCGEKAECQGRGNHFPTGSQSHHCLQKLLAGALPKILTLLRWRLAAMQ